MDYGLANLAAASKRKPGLTEVLYAVRRELSLIAVPSPSASTPAGRVTVATAHEFTDETNGFRSIFVSKEDSEAMLKSFGSKYSKGTQGVVEMFIPGITAESLGFVNEDDEFIILIPNGPCGTSEYLQLGDRCAGVNIESWEAKTEKFGGNATKGIKITLDSKQFVPLIYTAAVPLPS